MRRLLTALVALALIVAACGDDDAGDDVTTTTTTTMVTTTTTTADGGDMDPSDGGDMDAPHGTPGDVQGLLEAFARAEVRATYDIEGETMILSQDPPRSAWIFPDGARIIQQEDGSVVFCGGDGSCFQSPSMEGMTQMFTAGMLNPFFFGLMSGDESVAELPGFGISESSATIAGRQATCFTFDPDVAGIAAEEFRQCVDTETGLTLLIEGEAADGSGTETLLEVVEVGEPQESDFEITGELMEMPTG